MTTLLLFLMTAMAAELDQARSLDEANLTVAARLAYAEVVGQAPGNSEALASLVRLCRDEGQADPLRPFLDDLAANPPVGAEALVARLSAEALLVAGQPDAALAALDAMDNTPLDPGLQRAYYLRGQIHHHHRIHEPKLKSAVMGYRRVMTAASEPALAEDEGLRDLALLEISRIYVGLGRLENAANYYEMTDQGSIWADVSALEHGWTLIQLDDLDGARKVLKRVDGWDVGAKALDALARTRADQARGRPDDAPLTAYLDAIVDEKGLLVAAQGKMIEEFPGKLRASLLDDRTNGVAPALAHREAIDVELAQIADVGVPGLAHWRRLLEAERDRAREKLEAATTTAIQVRVDRLDAWVRFVEADVAGGLAEVPDFLPVPAPESAAE